MFSIFFNSSAESSTFHFPAFPALGVRRSPSESFGVLRSFQWPYFLSILSLSFFMFLLNFPVDWCWCCRFDQIFRRFQPVSACFSLFQPVSACFSLSAVRRHKHCVYLVSDVSDVSDVSGFHEQWSQWSQWSHRFVQSSGNWDEAGSCIDSSTFHPLFIPSLFASKLRVSHFAPGPPKSWQISKRAMHQGQKLIKWRLQDIARYCKILQDIESTVWWLFLVSWVSSFRVISVESTPGFVFCQACAAESRIQGTISALGENQLYAYRTYI